MVVGLRERHQRTHGAARVQGPQSILSRAINAAVKVGFSGMPQMRAIEQAVQDAPRVDAPAPNSGSDEEVDENQNSDNLEEASRG